MPRRIRRVREGAPGNGPAATPVPRPGPTSPVLADARATERRLRKLLAQVVGAYFVPALGLFPGTGYRGVRAKLTGALDGLGPVVPSPKALRDLRRRPGAAPLKALFEALAGRRPGRASQIAMIEALIAGGTRPGSPGRAGQGPDARQARRPDRRHSPGRSMTITPSWPGCC